MKKNQVDKKNLSYPGGHVQFLMDVQETSNRGIMAENLLHHRAFNAIGNDEASSSIDNTSGGFLLPQSLVPTPMELALSGSQFDAGALTSKIPMDAQTVYIPARTDKDHSTGSVTGGIRLSRTMETDALDTSKGQYEQIKLEAATLGGVSFASDLLLFANPAVFASIVNSAFKKEFIARMNYERLWGSGIGEALGIFNSSALITVPKESNQTAKTITDANVSNMLKRAWGYKNAVWMVNSDCLGEIVKLDGYDKINFNLHSRPIIPDENMKTLGELGDITLVNWGEYLEGYLGGASLMESIHVRFENSEKCYRFTVFNDGEPFWRSALTPKNGTATLSPYITLAERK